MRRHRTHRNALPEHATYRDTGCQLAPKCLECPLPACWYETKRPSETLAGYEQQRRARELRRQGRRPAEIAAALGLSLRHAYRLMAKAS